MGFCPIAFAVALNEEGFPMEAATSLYVTVLPTGISSNDFHTDNWKEVPSKSIFVGTF